jgi:hypothetical protein
MSGALAFDAAWLFAAFLVLIVLLAAGITARRYLLERGGGTVECGLRARTAAGASAWPPTSRMSWLCFRVRLQPSQVFNGARCRPPRPHGRAASLGEGAVVVECRVTERPVESR